MSDKIDWDDILGPDAIAKIKEFNDSIRQTAEFVKSLEKSSNKLNTNNFYDSSSIVQHKKDVIESIKLENQFNAEKQKTIKIGIDIAKTNDRIAKEQAKITSEYTQSAKALERLAHRQMDNAVAGRELSKTAKLVADAHADLKVKVEKAEQSVGKFFRNVGNYKSGYNGLSNSINQLTREMPAFANSMQTGFMAISNNLPIFFDEIKKTNNELKDLQATGQKTPSLLSALGSAFFSWGTLLSVGVTLLTVYGKEIVIFIGHLFDQNEAFKLNEQSLKAFNDELERSKKNQSDLNKSTNSSTKDSLVNDKVITESARKRLDALEDFQDEYDKIESSRKKAAIDGISEQLKNGDKEIEIVQKVTDKYIDIRKKGSNESIKIDLEAKKVLSQSSFFGKKMFSTEENALQEKLDSLNGRNAGELNSLNASYEAQKAAIGKTEKLKSKTATSKKNDDFKATDQDKRNIEAMENVEKKKQESIDRLKKWEAEALEVETKTSDLERDLRDQQAKEEDEAFKKSVENLHKEGKEKDKEAKKNKKRQKEEIEATFSFVNELNKAKNDSLQTQLNNDLEMRQRNILQQQQLAMAGKDNTLAFEKAAAAKDELAKQELAKKQEKQAKALAFLKLLSAYADKGSSDDAVAKTLVQMAIAGAIIGSYKDGVEGIDGDGTETSDSILARLSKNESVVTAKGTRENAGLPTAMNKGKVDEYFEQKYLPKYLTENGGVGFAENTMNSMLLKQFTTMNEEIKGIKRELKERPTSSVNLDNLGNVINTQVINGFKKQSTKKNGSSLNYI